MAFLIARVAGTREGTLNTRIGTISLVVSNFTAVVALASEATTFRLVRAFTGEMAGLVAAIKSQ